jgi:hypothetical protein
VTRPCTRADCEQGARPCPWISCRYHLFEELAPRILKVKKDKLRDEPDERLLRVLLGMEYSCSLDWAAKGPHTLDQIGQMFGVTRERIRQIQDKGLKRLTGRCGISIKKDIIEILQEMGSRDGVKEWK